MLRKISSNYIFSHKLGLLKFGIIEISSNGDINIIDTGGEICEIHSLEFYSGLLFVGEISIEQFSLLSCERSSFDILFDSFEYIGSSVFLLSNVDFVNKCFKLDSRIKKLY